MTDDRRSDPTAGRREDAVDATGSPATVSSDGGRVVDAPARTSSSSSSGSASASASPSTSASTSHSTSASATGRLTAVDQALAVAAREYRLAMRRRWILGATLVFAVFSAGVVGFGGSDVAPAQYDAVLVSLVELGVYLVPLVGLAVGYDAVVGAAERGSLELVRSLPAPAWTVVVGKYGGRAAALAGAVIVGFTPGLALAYAGIGPAAIGSYAVVVLVATLAALGFLAIGVLISTVVGERTRALGVALAAWLWFVLLHDLVVLGAIATVDLSGAAVAIAVLANPADCFRVLALQQFDVLAGGFGAVARAAGLSTLLTLAGALAWIFAPVAVAARLMPRS